MNYQLNNSPDIRKRIALDMDEVMADVVPKFLEYYERDFGVRPAREQWWGKKIYQLPNAAHIRSYLDEKGFFADLPVMEDCREVVGWLTRHYDVFAVTAATEFRNSLEDKYDWLERHFPSIGWQRLVLCGDKSIIHADYMIDDHVKNLEKFTGKGLLYTASHNIPHRPRKLQIAKAEVRAFFEKQRNTAGQKA